jgi:glutamate transport system substrate-binding protein
MPETPQTASGQARSSARVLKTAFLSALAVILLACSNSSSNASRDFAQGTTMADLVGDGRITIAVKYDQPGFGALGPGGKPAGFDVEIGRIITTALGLGPDDITWRRATAGNREQLLESGQADLVIATYTMTEDRADRVGFVGPYYIAGQQMMVRDGENDISGPDDLHLHPNRKVCSVAGSTPAATIRRYLARPDQLITKAGYAQCVEALRAGQAQAITTDNAILLGLVAFSDNEFEIVGDPFTEEPYGIGIAKGDTAFCTFISDTLQRAADDGSYYDAWASTAGSIPQARTPRLPQLDRCS